MLIKPSWKTLKSALLKFQRANCVAIDSKFSMRSSKSYLMNIFLKSWTRVLRKSRNGRRMLSLIPTILRHISKSDQVLLDQRWSPLEIHLELRSLRRCVKNMRKFNGRGNTASLMWLLKEKTCQFAPMELVDLAPPYALKSWSNWVQKQSLDLERADHCSPISRLVT